MILARPPAGENRRWALAIAKNKKSGGKMVKNQFFHQLNVISRPFQAE
jgi:hypothetical protein